MRTCKKCNKHKEHTFLCMAANGRAVFKDEKGKTWHGKLCGTCYARAVWLKSRKKPLINTNCIVCKAAFKQKTIKQRRCDEHKLNAKDKR